ncbi:TlpA family protein disulfide reductase [Cumulibacter manganitolerans]|uniref:TlpA family protein disulfide reductase n=1 Tax=Cumulibacter manganitolerans TaxID=1884992 RepID=UPI001E4F9EC5|nr:TlpA disulfide reductase family protein [Cumulibacter manganitolerans]
MRVLAAVASIAVLAGCGAEGAGGGAPASVPPAAKAPPSEFTVGCPAFGAPAAKGAGGAKNGALPAVSLECLGSEGDPITLNGTPPGPTVINLWASWCAPCRAEMPIIEKLAQQGHGTVQVLGIATGDARSAATAFAVEFGMTFPSVLDPKNKVVGAQGLQGLPATLFVDGSGDVVYVHPLPYKSYDELASDVAEHLKVTL